MAVRSVTLRKYPISKGRESLYIQYYPSIRNEETMKMTQKEMLGIYIYQNPKTEIEKEFNKEMLYKAEAIRSMRMQAVVNEEFGFLDKDRQKQDFLAYFAKVATHKYQKWMKVHKHFENFVKGKCIFSDINVDICRKFRNYLLNDAYQLANPKKKLKRNSAAGYFSTFRALLKVAFRDRRLKENVNDYLDKITWEDVKKEFLTLDELEQLANTPCDIPALKNASMFACLTGLRISDILQLEWKHIEKTSLSGYCVRIRTEKTETEATLPISDEALEWCGKRSTGKVFTGLIRSMTQYTLAKWIKSAGITKNITFHMARHNAFSSCLQISRLHVFQGKQVTI